MGDLGAIDAPTHTHSMANPKKTTKAKPLRWMTID